MSGTKNPNSVMSSGEMFAPPTGSLRPAGFGRRAVASLIDSALIFSLLGGFELFLRTLLLAPGILQMYVRIYPAVDWLFWVIDFVVQFVFYGYMLSRKGATPGKLVMRLRVLDDAKGTHLSFMRAGFRCALGYWVSFVPLGVGYLMVAFRSDKKALHDLMFGSHVWYHEK